jgi:hypothetical protein
MAVVCVMDDAKIADSPLSSLVRAASVSSTCETNRNIPAKFPKQPSLKTVTACFPRVDSDPSKFYLLLSVCFGAYNNEYETLVSPLFDYFIKCMSLTKF